MKIDTISYTEKFNKGNYESVEVGFTAAVEEGESAIDVLHTLKALSHNFFHSETQPALQVEEPKVEEKPKVVEEKPKKEKPKKEKKSKSEEMADIVDGQEVPPVITNKEEMEEVESPFTNSSKAVIYDLKNKDHRDRLAAYLNKTYPNWKTKPKETLLSMSQELSGKPFEDLNGVMLDSFKNVLSGYFE